jgi:uncharacterized protein YbaR (Trm112 family)
MEYVKILRCPNSNCIKSKKEPLRGLLKLIDAKYRKGLLYGGILKCSTCGEEFPIKDGVPNLLPERIRKYLDGKLSINELTEYDREIVSGIKWSEKMVPSYHENVVDPFISALGARYIERYEDLYIDSVLDKCIGKKMKTIFIEMGVGTGRYLIRYGSRLLNNEIMLREKLILPYQWYRKQKVCKVYRKDPILKKYYSYDSDYDQHLQLLIGIDFQKEMIRRCIKNLRDMKIHPLYGNRILLLVGAAQYFNMALDDVEDFKSSFKVVTCVFQTLGNQKEELQIGLLKTLKRLASPHGIIIVSVFNKKQFHEFGLKRFYKLEVAPTVGEIREDEEALALQKKGILVTRRGVYSQWFSEDDLERVLKAAGLDAKIKSENRLPIFKDTEYLAKDIQENLIKNVLIIAECKV